LAARLQSVAGTDEVIIAPATHRLLGQTFLCKDLGERTLKGIVNPVRAWQAVKISGIEGRFEATRAPQLSPLVGRDEELQLFVRREQLQRAAKFSADDSVEQKFAKIERLMAVAQGETPSAVLLVAILLGIPPSAKYPPLNYPAQKQRDETIRVLTQQLTELAKQAPVLVVLEDAHWLDPSSLETFDAIIQKVNRQRILLLLSFRPEFVPKWMGLGHVTTVTLNRFSKRQAVELIKGMAGKKRLPDAVVEQIAARSDGIPLFAEELTKTLLESELFWSPVTPTAALATRVCRRLRA